MTRPDRRSRRAGAANGARSSTTALLARSDAPRSVVVAAAVAREFATVAVVAVVVAVVAVLMGWAPVAWAGVVVAAAWVACCGVVAAVTMGPWSLAAAAAVGALGAWASTRDSGAVALLVGLPLLALAVGMVAGVVARLAWDRRQANRDRRLAALPDWERDELGVVADGLDPAFRRSPAPDVVGSRSDPAVRLARAVCRPLPGATVLAGEPTIAVNGSRVAVVARGERMDRMADAPPLPPLPAGVTARVFVLREGTELGSLGPDGPIELVATEPHDLAAHLAAGTPPDGDALHGVAADLHARVLAALDDYPGESERRNHRRNP
ncbi:hypothetical protein [uncultured Corynebacterium sp.]|uniref:hypothetical protein n=1 Tax=uncultured Corynebacterium sp. TaxID=159447 RepID=UPI0025DD0F33|nr:hypothetical protein [uncultured Corynebacterium sp.]